MFVTAFHVDVCEQVYIAGYAGIASMANRGEPTYLYPSSSIRGLKITPDALGKFVTEAGGFYYFVLAKNATAQKYGSFYGSIYDTTQSRTLISSDWVNGGISRFDNSVTLVQAYTVFSKIPGNTQGGYFPTTLGAWSEFSNNTAAAEAAAVKIAFNFAGVSASLQSNIAGVLATNACLPSTVSFTDTEAKGKNYRWLFGDGTPEFNTSVPTINHAYTGSGSYLVRLISVDSSTCNIADTAYLNIRTGIHKTTNSFNATLVQPCTNRSFSFNNTSTKPNGAPAFTNQSYTWDFGDGATATTGIGATTHNYATPGNYIVKLILKDTAFCNAPDTITKIITAPGTIQAAFGFSSPTG